MYFVNLEQDFLEICFYTYNDRNTESLETEFYSQNQVYIFDPCRCFIHNVLKKVSAKYFQNTV